MHFVLVRLPPVPRFKSTRNENSNLDVQLILVGANVDERHVGGGAVVRKIPSRDVVVAEQVDFGQLAVDQPPGVDDRTRKGVAPKDRVLLSLANDAFGNDSLDLERKQLNCNFILKFPIKISKRSTIFGKTKINPENLIF